LYQKLFQLKHSNQALWNGAYGGEMVRIVHDKPEQVLSFSRQKNGNQIISIFNFSVRPVTVTLRVKYGTGYYTDVFTDEEYELKTEDTMTLPPWGYRVLAK